MKLSPKNIHLAKVVKKAAVLLGIDQPVIITWTHSKKGQSVPNAKMIFIPHAAFKKGMDYLTYYIVHELCHLREFEHTDVFKQLETGVLLEFGITIEYDGIYAKNLYRAGEKVFSTKDSEDRND